MYVQLKPQNVVLFRNRVFADVIKDHKMRSPGFRVDPKSSGLMPLEQEERTKRDPETYRGEGHMKMEAEIEVTLPKTRKCQGLPAPIRS